MHSPLYLCNTPCRHQASEILISVVELLPVEGRVWEAAPANEHRGLWVSWEAQDSSGACACLMLISNERDANAFKTSRCPSGHQSLRAALAPKSTWACALPHRMANTQVMAQTAQKPDGEWIRPARSWFQSEPFNPDSGVFNPDSLELWISCD